MNEKTTDKKCTSASSQIIREHYYRIGLEYCWTAWIYTVTEVDGDVLEQEVNDACFGC